MARKGNRGQGPQRQSKRPPSKYSEALLQVSVAVDVDGEAVVMRVGSLVGIGRVGIEPSDTHGSATIPRQGYWAVWDTGAPFTIIKPEVAEKAGIEGYAMVPLSGVTGETKIAPRARIVVAIAAVDTSTRRPHHQLHMLDHVVIHDLGVEFDVLIGMDLIARGDLEFVSDRAGRRVGLWRSPSRPRVIRYPDHS